MKKVSLILTLFIFIFASCKKDSTNSSTPQTINIGDSAYGGIIFYIDNTKQHGLVCATTDQSTSAVWDANSYPNGVGIYNPTPTGAAGTVIGTGSTNTTKIISVLGGNGVAASLCRNYRGGGFADWFLPSKVELNEFYNNKAVVGGLASGYYWSSSEVVGSNLTFAWGQTFLDGSQNYYNKLYYTFYVRAVRALQLFSRRCWCSSPTSTNRDTYISR